jgi:hypothetical protein
MPDIVEAILDGRQPVRLDVNGRWEGFSVKWVEQRTTLRDRRPAAQ